ncbi:hypothetical protein GmRootV15_39430 [Variovorax sp. V15]
MNVIERYRGCLLGLACGDAVGTTVEFRTRGSFAPVTGMHGGGPFGLVAGEWTDDTSMALCLAASLIHCKGFDAIDQMNRYCNWRSVGYMSSTGNCFDIGLTVSGALTRYLASGDPFAGDPDPRTAGNGALMRLAPVPMFYAASAEATWTQAGESARTTHGALEAIECSRLFALQLRSALLGKGKAAILSTEPLAPLNKKVAALTRNDHASRAPGRSRDRATASNRSKRRSGVSRTPAPSRKPCSPPPTSATTPTPLQPSAASWQELSTASQASRGTGSTSS